MFKPLSKKILAVGLALIFDAGTVLAAEMKSASTETKTSSKLSSADSSFVKEAAQGGLLEVELGKVAQEKASDPKVKEFGKRMEQDHGKVNDELKKFASDKGIQLAAELDRKHKSKVAKLSKLSGAKFDQQYMQDMVSDHKADIKEFQRESEKGKDADLQKFASQSLATLKEHLQLAESTAQQVKSSEKSGRKL